MQFQKMILEEVVTTIEEAQELPAVKRVYKSRFIQGKKEELEKFLGKIVRKNVEKAVNPAIKRQKTVNIVLLNMVVLSYFAGKTNAHDLTDWTELLTNYKVIGIYTIIANITGLLLLGFGQVLRNASRILLKVFSFLIVGLVIYLVGNWIYTTFIKTPQK